MSYINTSAIGNCLGTSYHYMKKRKDKDNLLMVQGVITGTNIDGSGLASIAHSWIEDYSDPEHPMVINIQHRKKVMTPIEEYYYSRQPKNYRKYKWADVYKNIVKNWGAYVFWHDMSKDVTHSI